MVKQKIPLIIFVMMLGVVTLIGGFWYLRISNSIQVGNQPKVIYKVWNFDAQGAPIRVDYHSVSIDGTDDRLVYSTPIYGETLKVLSHRDIAIGTSTANIFLNKTGEDISDIYKAVSNDISMESYNSPAYSIDKSMVAVIGRSSLNDLPEISALNVKTKQVTRYPCSECKNYQGHYLSGFSRDGKKLYFYVVRDRPNHPLDADPDLKYLYMDVESGTIVNLNVAYNNRESYVFYPQYDLALKLRVATHNSAGSIDLINLSDMSEKRLVDDLGEQGGIIFNGKDVVYGTFNDRSVPYYSAQEVRGVNIDSRERYPILPPILVNTPKIGAKELIDFFPDSARFIYTVQHDSGWELRMHDIDTGEDRIISNLTGERFSDKTFYFKQYVGVIF